MHAHAHNRSARLRADRRALSLALVLVASFMAVEVVAGVLADSLALLADAGHMLADAASLALALFAVRIAATPATPQRSFGLRRAEILAALANGVALVAISLWIFVEAAGRFRDPPEPLGGWMLGVGLLGLAVNVGAAAVLARGRAGSLNVQAAYRHVLADLAGSLGVVTAGAVVLATGWGYADPLVAVAIGVLVLASSWGVLRDSIGVLLEATPRGIDAREVGRAMAAHAGVHEVHDLHIWTITSGFPALSAHVLVDPGADCHGVRRELEGELASRFSLTHTTLQVEHVGESAATVTLGEPYRRQGPLEGD